MIDRKFFVVRTVHGVDRFSFEHGDFSDRHSKSEKAAIVYRAEMSATDTTSLDEAPAAYKRGVRMKPMPKGPAPIAPKTKSSVKERYLAKLRASEGADLDPQTILPD